MYLYVYLNICVHMWICCVYVYICIYTSLCVWMADGTTSQPPTYAEQSRYLTDVAYFTALYILHITRYFLCISCLQLTRLCIWCFHPPPPPRLYLGSRAIHDMANVPKWTLLSWSWSRGKVIASTWPWIWIWTRTRSRTTSSSSLLVAYGPTHPSQVGRHRSKSSRSRSRSHS
jgi:hypothetical protein